MMKKIILTTIILTIIIAEANFHFLRALEKLKDDDLSNNTQAVKELKILAENNESNAAYLLGYYYKTQTYEDINLNNSHKYYLKAAILGDKDAMLIVGWNFYKGIGTKVDLKQSRFWLEKLAILGDEIAEEILNYIYE